MLDKLIALVLLLLVSLWVGPNCWSERGHSQWTRTTCSVESTSVRYLGATKYNAYVLEIYATWHHLGQKYTPVKPWDWRSDQESIAGSEAFESLSEAEDFASEFFPEGADFTCYASPSEPSVRSFGRPSSFQANTSLGLFLLLAFSVGSTFFSLMLQALPSRRWMGTRGRLTGSQGSLGGQDIPEKYTVWPAGLGSYSIADSSGGWVASLFCLVSFIVTGIVYGIVWSGLYGGWCMVLVTSLFALVQLIVSVLFLTQLFYENRLVLSDQNIVKETYFLICVKSLAVPIGDIEDCRVLTDDEVGDLDLAGLYLLYTGGEKLCIEPSVDPGTWIEGVLRYWISQHQIYRR